MSIVPATPPIDEDLNILLKRCEYDDTDHGRCMPGSFFENNTTATMKQTQTRQPQQMGKLPQPTANPPKQQSNPHNQNKPTQGGAMQRRQMPINNNSNPTNNGTGDGATKKPDLAVPSLQANANGMAINQPIPQPNHILQQQRSKPTTQPNTTGGAAKNPVRAAFRLVQQSWSRTVTVNVCDAKDNPKIFRFKYLEVIGNGTFGIVCKAKDLDTDETVAIKTVFQDQHHQNRELFIIKALQHECIVGLKYYFYTRNEYNEEFLSLVLEYMPSSLDRLQPGDKTDSLIRKLMHNFLLAVDYLHKRGVCHRDIKPHNVLVDPRDGRAKLCDFGCSKRLVAGEPNIQYICARYYRAPEIAFGWPHYTLAIDTWSVGCVMAELYTGRPLFPGKNSVDQLAKIVKVLGTPDAEELAAMGQDPNRFRHPARADPDAKRRGLTEALCNPDIPDDAIDLMLGLLQYNPRTRLTASQALAHPYFGH